MRPTRGAARDPGAHDVVVRSEVTDAGLVLSPLRTSVELVASRSFHFAADEVALQAPR